MAMYWLRTEYMKGTSAVLPSRRWNLSTTVCALANCASHLPLKWMAQESTRLVSVFTELGSRIGSMCLLVAAAKQPLISPTAFSGFTKREN